MTQAAALVAALGVVALLLFRSRGALLAGIGLLALGGGVLAVSLVPRGDLAQAVTSPLRAGALVAGVAVVVGIALVFLRRPGLVPVLVLAAAPFRLPASLGEQDAFLLIPLYAVLAAATLALAVRALRGEELRAPPLLLAAPAAAYVGLACVSYLWTSDRPAGALQLVFFLLPFTLLLAVVARAPREPWLPKALAGTTVGLGVVFALVGLWEEATHTLFFAPTLEVANAYTTFFRVTSLFKDPSLYGRNLVIPIGVLLVLVLRRRVPLRYGGPAIAFLWLGLYPSYSQSSMLALIVVVAALGLLLGDRRERIAIGATVLLIAAVGTAAFAKRTHGSPLRQVTRGRSTLVTSAARAYLRRPIAGVGIGAQPRASATEPDRSGSRARAASHTTPLTVAAELGTIGLALYLGLLAAAFALLRNAWRNDRDVALALGAAFTTILVQSFVYSGFFEDPLMWESLGIASLFMAPRPVESARATLARIGAWRPTRLQALLGAAVVAAILGVVGAAALARVERPSAGGLVTNPAAISVSVAKPAPIKPAPSKPVPTRPKPGPQPKAVPHALKPKPKSVEAPCWRAFGGGPTRALSRPAIRLGRPTKSVWARGLHDLMEYPPTYCAGRLYVNLERGKTVALDADTGKILWTKRALGATASSPAIADGRVIVSTHGGAVTALRAADGATLWQLRTNSAMESSPVVVGATVFVGAADGRLFSLDARNGRARWIYDTGGRISSSPSVVAGRVCITTYSGSVVCLREGDGGRIWSRYFARNAFQSESFYASASTDGERLFAVARSGRVVALSIRDGRTIWSASTFATTYGTPSVAHGLVNVADLSGNVRAYRASTGAELWRMHVGGRILGPTVVVGGLLFFSTLNGSTYAVQTHTGRLVWSFRAGKYAPGIATRKRYYFSLNGLLVAFDGERSAG